MTGADEISASCINYVCKDRKYKVLCHLLDFQFAIGTLIAFQ